MNRNKCNDVDEKIIPYMDNTDCIYVYQDDDATFKKTEIDYAIDIHGNYMDTAMHIIYTDSPHTSCDAQSSLKHFLDNPFKIPPPQSPPLLKPPIITMALLQSSASFATTSSYDCDKELDGIKSHNFDIGMEIASDDDVSDA